MAATCAPTAPAAPALVSTTTGCLKIGSSADAAGRVTMSLAPPGGNALRIVMAREGNASCATRFARPRRRGGRSRAADDELTPIHRQPSTLPIDVHRRLDALGVGVPERLNSGWSR